MNNKKEKKEKKLKELCTKAKDTSHSPYSKFRVGCALLTQSGKIFTGCNVENSSYGLCICAERTAAVKAVSEGEKKFIQVWVTTDVKETFISPCGACRQFLSEFGDAEVVMLKPSGETKRVQLSVLLPYSFGSNDLLLEKVDDKN